ncbi:MAG: hypothetical protein JSS23_10950 [Proteobacteria bacterium]|nr:hypothetical protein [Pseudomonadota bacterium]
MRPRHALRRIPDLHPGRDRAASANPRFEWIPGVGHDRKVLEDHSTALFKQVPVSPSR